MLRSHRLRVRHCNQTGFCPTEFVTQGFTARLVLSGRQEQGERPGRSSGMTRLRMPRDPKPSWRQKRIVRGFNDDESDETVIGLGFVDTKAAAQPATES